jgi:hypothetical protein
MVTAMRARVCLLVSCTLALAAACSSSGPAADSHGTSSLSRGLSARDIVGSFIQYRIDEGTRHAAIRVTNKTSKPIDVTRVALRWSGVAARPPTPVDNEVTPGATVDYFFDLGTPRCQRGQGPPRAQVTADGSTVVVPVDRVGTGLLRDLWRRACATAAVDAAADIRFDTHWRPAGKRVEDGLRGTLVLVRRRPGVTVRVTSLQGSVLLDLSPLRRTTPIAELPPGQPRQVVPVVVGSNGRCDDHALGQSSQTFLLRVGVSVGTTTTQLVVSPDLAAQARIKQQIVTACHVNAQ